MIREYFKIDPLVHSGLEWDKETQQYLRVLCRPFMGKFAKPPIPIGKNGKPRQIFSPRLKQEINPVIRIGTQMFETKLKQEAYKRSWILSNRKKQTLTCEVIDVKPKYKPQKGRFIRKPATGGSGTRQFMVTVIEEREKAFLLRINRKDVWLPRVACSFASHGKQKILTISNWWANEKKL